MKRLVLLGCALLALAAPITAQTDEEIIERAVLAALVECSVKAQTILSAGIGLAKMVSAHSACNAQTKVTLNATNKILNSFVPVALQKRRKH